MNLQEYSTFLLSTNENELPLLVRYPMYHNTPLKVTHTLMLLCSFLSLVSLWTFVLVGDASLPDPATCIKFFSDLAGTAPLLNDSCTPNGAFGYIIRRTSTFSSQNIFKNGNRKNENRKNGNRKNENRKNE